MPSKSVKREIEWILKDVTKAKFGALSQTFKIDFDDNKTIWYLLLKLKLLTFESPGSFLGIFMPETLFTMTYHILQFISAKGGSNKTIFK